MKKILAVLAMLVLGVVAAVLLRHSAPAPVLRATGPASSGPRSLYAALDLSRLGEASMGEDASAAEGAPGLFEIQDAWGNPLAYFKEPRPRAPESK